MPCQPVTPKDEPAARAARRFAPLVRCQGHENCTTLTEPGTVCRHCRKSEGFQPHALWRLADESSPQTARRKGANGAAVAATAPTRTPHDSTTRTTA